MNRKLKDFLDEHEAIGIIMRGIQGAMIVVALLSPMMLLSTCIYVGWHYPQYSGIAYMGFLPLLCVLAVLFAWYLDRRA